MIHTLKSLLPKPNGFTFTMVALLILSNLFDSQAYSVAPKVNFRQYTQCSSKNPQSNERFVLNLTSQHQGTFMITPGVETDEFFLFQAFLEETKSDFFIYGIYDSERVRVGQVNFPIKAYGKSGNDLEIETTLDGISEPFLCFSRPYPL